MASHMAQSELDNLILTFCTGPWRKTAMVIGRTIESAEELGMQWQPEEVGRCIIALVKDGQLEAAGDLSEWRHSEVRGLPISGK